MKTELKRTLIAALIGSALGLALGGPALAAGDPAETSAAPAGAMTPMAGRDLRASKLIGMKVKNPQGETLGKIDDLVVDVNNERVHYAVLASGGVMGVGSKLFAYPVNLLREGADKEELVLNVDKEKLKQAPGFERKNWPDWASTQDRYRGEVERYFGPTVTAKAMPNERLMRASKLIGKDVHDRDGRNAGEIKDLVVNLGNGRVHYAVLDFDTSWMKSDKFAPLALHAFTFPAERESKDLVLNLAKNQLDASRGIEKKRWSDMDINEAGYQRNIDNLIAAMPPSGTRGAAGPSGTRRESGSAAPRGE